MKAIEDLAQMFDSKYAQAVANGATDEQAIEALRGLWLDHLKEN